MDDIDRNLAYEQRDFHKKLVEDIIEHLSSFENKELLFVHPWYNSAWIDDKGEEYFKLFRNVENLSIMWTGYDVVVPITKKAGDRFTELSGKNADIWFNWPVNDYLRDQIFMEVFEFFDSPEINYKSLLSNPMNQAELSKISIYQIESFLENPKEYDPLQAFKKALAYVDGNVKGELFIIANSFFGSGVYDRTEGKKYLEDNEIQEAYDRGDFDKVEYLATEKIKAIDSYFANYKNEKLYKEVRPFFTSLKFLLEAINYLLKKDYEKAKTSYKKTETCKVKILTEFTNDKFEERIVKTSRVLDEIYQALLEKSEI